VTFPDSPAMPSPSGDPSVGWTRHARWLLPVAFTFGFILTTFLWIPLPSPPIPDRSSPFIQWIAGELDVPPAKLTASRLRKLKDLHIPNLGYELESLDGLELCTGLESLTMDLQQVCRTDGDCGTCNGPWPELQPIASLTNLKRLKMGQWDPHLPEYLAPLQQLECLEMDLVDTVDWNTVPSLPRLRTLVVTGLFVTHTGWEGLAKQTALEEVSLMSILFESAELAELRDGLPHVRTLRLPRAYNIQTLAPLEDLATLEVLDLTDMREWTPNLLASAQALEVQGIDVIGIPES